MNNIPCGRTEEDKYLCCRRYHNWYNTKLVIENIRFCKNPIKRKCFFIVSGSIYCKICGSCVESFGGSSLIETIAEWLFGPWI